MLCYNIMEAFAMVRKGIIWKYATIQKMMAIETSVLV